MTISYQEAVQKSQQVRNLVGTAEMLELQASQLPADTAGKAEIMAQASALMTLINTAYTQAEAAKADVRAATVAKPAA